MKPWSEVLTLARQANDHYSMTERQQELVYELACTVPEGGMIVELGVCHGKTAVVLACAAQEIAGEYIGIDNWSLEGSERAVFALLAKTVPESIWELWEIDTHGEVARRRAAQMDGIDLLLIDAGHDEENVREDCNVWIPLVRPGGLVVFDDWPSGWGWYTSCHAAVRKNAERWCGEWEWAASFGKTVAFRRLVC